MYLPGRLEDLLSFFRASNSLCLRSLSKCPEIRKTKFDQTYFQMSISTWNGSVCSKVNHFGTGESIFLVKNGYNVHLLRDPFSVPEINAEDRQDLSTRIDLISQRICNYLTPLGRSLHPPHFPSVSIFLNRIYVLKITTEMKHVINMQYFFNDSKWRKATENRYQKASRKLCHELPHSPM